ncbi:hypothetical protein ACN28S_13180 [Cystobacter fuscus]
MNGNSRSKNFLVLTNLLGQGGVARAMDDLDYGAEAFARCRASIIPRRMRQG